MLKLISWFLFQLSAQVSGRQNLVPIEHDSSPSPLSSSPITFRSVCVTGSGAQMSNVPKAARTMELHQPAEENGQICPFIHPSLFMSLSCWIFPELSLSNPPSNLTTLLLCEINFREPLSYGGAPLSKAGFNSELNAMLIALRGP